MHMQTSIACACSDKTFFPIHVYLGQSHTHTLSLSLSLYAACQESTGFDLVLIGVMLAILFLFTVLLKFFHHPHTKVASLTVSGPFHGWRGEDLSFLGVCLNSPGQPGRIQKFATCFDYQKFFKQLPTLTPKL
jgi:hypothetical protein